MFELTLCFFAGTFIWLARRYWLLSRGIRSLTAAIEQRRSFLNEDDQLSQIHGSWRRLVAEASRLVFELNRLDQLRTGRLVQLETALRNLQEGVMIVDRENCIMLANNAVMSLCPSSSRVLGQRVEVILRSTEFLEFLEEVRRGEGGVRRELEFYAAGGPVWVEATGTSVPATETERGPWTLFVFHDITRQKQLESVRREFVANVSHELKTPLSVIKGYAETLVDGGINVSESERLQFLRVILRHSERLAAILEDLLAISRLESNNPGIQLTSIDLVSFLQSVSDDFSGTLIAPEQHFQLTLDLPRGIAVDGDPQRLTQVFGNLLDNARKYTPAGTRIVLGARADAAAHEVEIWVSDSGPGIPAVDLPRIFERFYRVEKGRSREKGGTGLGLSIVKHIVQLHRGRVWAESKIGEGTRIAFRLPVTT